MAVKNIVFIGIILYLVVDMVNTFVFDSKYPIPSVTSFFVKNASLGAAPAIGVNKDPLDSDTAFNQLDATSQSGLRFGPSTKEVSSVL